MTEVAADGITGCLERWRGGDSRALDELIPLVYDELRQMAFRRLRSERGDLTLQATEIAHEAYVRMTEKSHPRWRDRAHFFAVAALIMRRVLIDHARKKRSARRGGGWRPLPADAVEIVSPAQADELLLVDELLSGLASVDQRKSRVVEMRLFAGMTINETARALGVAPMTVVREWRSARAWMAARINGGGRLAGEAE